MKKISLLLLTPLMFIHGSAQIPQALNYQAIARNSLGQIIPSQPIGIRFTISDASGATIFYQETHNTTTNNFGLFTLSIGKGTAVSGAIASIDWSTGGDKFLKVEIAPQGGSNYTIQGTTQLLSVPYALYSEKTKLTGGNAISITNGNTINATYQPGNGITIAGNIIASNYQAGNAITITGNTISGNYQAGTGINIIGNTISATTNNSWLLNGNTGTTAANFLGTTDNNSLYLRTNNVNRLMIDAGQAVTGGNMSTAFLSDFASIKSSPAQFAVYGKDVAGIGLPVHLFSSVEGMNWAATGGSTNNTLGRFLRMTQMISPNYSDGQYFDFGIDQGVSFYISNRGLNTTGGILPKKMMTISSQDFVGINFDWGQNPTANFHTRGTVRLEGINTNNLLTRVLVMDVNGNVSSRDANTLTGTNGDWSLLGNSGTTSANFLGTADNQSLYLRTNNVNRLMIDPGQPVTGGNMSTAFLSDFTSIRTAPAQFAVYGKDVAGIGLPVHLFSSVEGMNWAATGGSTNNTLGRFLRMTQMISPNYADGQYFDFGIDQGVSFYISNTGQNTNGGVLPKKMITVSPQNFVGINFDWGQNPTANFHTKGTVRFEGINTDNALTRVVVMDANGNVFSKDASTLNGLWVADANGIHNSNTGHVGIGGSSSNISMLNVEMLENTLDGREMARFASNDSWQTKLRMDNNTNNKAYSLVIGGTDNTIVNYGVGLGNFGIVNESTLATTSTIPLIITSDNKVGISNSNGGTDNLPKSRLHVRDGDIYIDQIGSGVIMKSPNGQCWRMTVSNAGTPVFTAITCP